MEASVNVVPYQCAICGNWRDGTCERGLPQTPARHTLNDICPEYRKR